jgi:hypothetical protein
MLGKPASRSRASGFRGLVIGKMVGLGSPSQPAAIAGFGKAKDPFECSNGSFGKKISVLTELIYY